MSTDIQEYFKAIEPEEVIQIVCHVKGVNQDFLFSGRHKILVQTRQLIAFFMRRYCYGNSYQSYRWKMIKYNRLTIENIALYLRQDHSTVTYAIKCINRNMRLYPNDRKEIEIIDDIIRRFRFVKEKPSNMK